MRSVLCLLLLSCLSTAALAAEPAVDVAKDAVPPAAVGTPVAPVAPASDLLEDVAATTRAAIEELVVLSDRPEQPEQLSENVRALLDE